MNKLIKENLVKIKITHVIIFLLTVVFIIGGYFIFVLYQNNKAETTNLLTSQQKAIDDAQQKITDLQKSNAQQKQSQATNQNNPNNNSSLTNSEITSSDINSLLTGVAEINCGTSDGYVQGSGSLWKIGNNYVVLTNEHVISSTPANGSCNVYTFDDQQSIRQGLQTLSFMVYMTSAKAWNSDTDVAMLDIKPYGTNATTGISGDLSLSLSSEAITRILARYNYKISNLGLCPPAMQIGTPVAVIGYPAFAQTNSQPVDSQGNFLTNDALTVTNGVISAYDSSNKSLNIGSYSVGNLPYANYFVSNRIDHGNSGGIAISKNNGKLCVLGIPTWLNQGVSDNQGIVQDINNVMYSK